jgi:hypothetical protein
VLTRLVQRAFSGRQTDTRPLRMLQIVFTFHVVCCAWIFFRASTFEAATAVFQSLLSLNFGVGNLMKPAVFVLLAAMVAHAIPRARLDQLRDLFAAVPAPLQASLLVAAVSAAHYLARTEVSPFIYFQF